MDNEKYFLHNWEKNNIYPKSKKNSLSQLTIETILNLRCFLIDKKVNGFKDKSLNNSITDSVLGGSPNLAAAKNKESLDS